MRQFFLWICFSWSFHSVAQQVEAQRQINITYQPYTVQDEKALVTIETNSVVLPKSTVSYRAGQSITLNPGFDAQNGSILIAKIEPIHVQDQLGMHLVVAPNPVSMNTIIDYTIPTKGEVGLSIVDVKGAIIKEFVKETKESGTYKHYWDSSQLTTGSYICVLRLDSRVISVRIIKQ